MENEKEKEKSSSLFDDLSDKFSELKDKATSIVEESTSKENDEKKDKKKKKKSRKQIELENEKKYIKNGENYYPYARESQLAWKTVKKYMKFSFIIVSIYYLLLIFANQLYPAVSNFWEYLKATMAYIKITLAGSTPDASLIFNGDRLAQASADSTERFQYLMNNFNQHFLFKLMFIGFVVLLIFHLTLIWLRRKNGEIKPMKNDALARTIKRQTLEALDLDYTNFDLIFPDRDIDGKVIKRWKNRTDKLADQAIRSMDVSVHTRKDINGNHFHQRGVVRIKQPVQVEVRKQVLSKLDDAQGIFGASSDGVLSFGERGSEVTRDFFTWRAERDVTEEIEEMKQKAFIKPSGKGGKGLISGNGKVETQWAYSLDNLVDRTDTIEEKERKAREYAEGRSKDIDNYMATNNYTSTLTSIDVGSSSVSFVYKMEVTKYNVQTIEEELVRQLNVPNIQVSAYAGSITITLPLDSDMKIPMDTRTMFENMFALDEPIKKNKALQKMSKLKYPSGAPMYIVDNKAKNSTHTIFGQQPNNDYYNRPMSEAPHILVAGTTGSGKSVTLNFLTLAMMAHATPKQLKMAFVDPKKVEFAPYEDNPYLITNPITDMDKASDFLIYLTILMDERYELLSKAGVKNIDGYNEWAIENGEETWEYIVLIVDEYADLKMQNDDVEKPIIRIAQKARAAGIHMILATQSPRANVVTGLIKANFPTRVAHMVANGTESAIILDDTGAEKLSPHGDMFIKWGGGNQVRAQAGFISDKELFKILDEQKELYPEPDFVDWESIVEEHNEKTGGGRSSLGARGRRAPSRTPSRYEKSDPMEELKKQRERQDKIGEKPYTDNKEEEQKKVANERNKRMEERMAISNEFSQSELDKDDQVKGVDTKEVHTDTSTEQVPKNPLTETTSDETEKEIKKEDTTETKEEIESEIDSDNVKGVESQEFSIDELDEQDQLSDNREKEVFGKSKDEIERERRLSERRRKRKNRGQIVLGDQPREEQPSESEPVSTLDESDLFI